MAGTPGCSRQFDTATTFGGGTLYEEILGHAYSSKMTGFHKVGPFHVMKGGAG